MRGVAATVVMPRSSAAVKRAAVAGYGARVVPCADGDQARAAAAQRVVEREGATLIHPYGHPHVVAGQGTLALELLEQVADLDAVVAPIGGGGCLSGIAVAVARAASARPRCSGRSRSAPTTRHARWRRAASCRACSRIRWPTDCAPPWPRLTFSLLRAHGVRIVTVSEEQIVAAMRSIWMRMKLVVEPSAAVSLAAVLGHAAQFRGRRVGVVLTGGNVDLERLPWNAA